MCLAFVAALMPEILGHTGRTGPPGQRSLFPDAPSSPASLLHPVAHLVQRRNNRAAAAQGPEAQNRASDTAAARTRALWSLAISTPATLSPPCLVPGRAAREKQAIQSPTMQPWPNQSQNGADGHAASWSPGFIFSSQPGQFDPNHDQWPDQPTTTFSQMGHDASATDYHFDSVHHANPGAFLADQPGQSGFHASAGHASMPLNQHQQFSAAGQDMLDPAFTNMHPDLFAPQQHPNKVNLVGAAIGQMELGQSQNHPSVFAQHDYSFPSQNSQPFDPSPGPSHFTPPLMPRSSSSRQQSHTPVQQHFDGSTNIHTGFTQNQAFPRHSQQSPLHHPHQQHQHPHRPQHQPPPQPQPPPQQSQSQPQSQTQPQPQRQHRQQPQPTYSGGDQSFAPNTNGQRDHFQVGTSSHLAYASQYREPTPQSHLQQAHFQQPGFGAQKPVAFQQHDPGSVGAASMDEQQRQQQQSQAANRQSAPLSGHGLSAPSHPSVIEIDTTAEQSAQGVDPQATRRKRATRDVAGSEPLTADLLLVECSTKRNDESDSLQPPVPSTEEAKLMAESAKKAKAAHSKIPSSKALPFLAYDGNIKLPAPKSYDKLAPLVAVPPRSGKTAVPGLGYDLPCEIQGKFTGQYKPSFDRIGLDERRDEAKTLLDNYDRSMRALGKRQPKYTEYPHAFKEQLKADEASKNKAEKKAKKELEEERNKPIRAPTRPADPAAAAAWDITGIVHIEQAVARTNALIAGRVQQAGEFLISLRGESTRAKQALDQAIKDKKPDGDIARLKHVADQKRETLYQALDATVEHADDAVLDNLGGHQKLVLNLVNTLITCIKASDFSGKLPKIVLELFTHLSMTRKIVETTNFDTVRKRLEDKGDSEVKDLVRELSSKVRKFNKSNESDTATGYTGTSAASRAKSGTKSAVGESSKRGRDDDSDASRSVKKMAIEGGASSSSLSKKLAQPKSQPSLLASKMTAAAAPRPAISSLLPGKPRPVVKPVSRAPEPVVAAMATTTDSPSASGDEKSKSELKKPASKPEIKTATVKKEVKATPVSSAVSSISSLLDSINAKKPEVAAAAAAGGSREGKRSETPETPEKTAKRLRKEARRKLRVSWKPEGELVQIKVFEKDEDEDQGRDMNMIRDAADDRSEGMVLKRRGSVAMEEEDDELPYRPWVAPTVVDLSSLTEERRSKNYVTRGGHIVLGTEEQKLMAEREQRELMAIYTDPADIPPSPKSPPLEMMAAAGATAKMGQLPDDEPMFSEVHRRWREAEQMGADQALVAAIKRLDAKNKPSTKLDSILGRLHQTGSGAGLGSAAVRHPAMVMAAKASNAPLAVGPAAEPYVLGWLRWDRMPSWRDANPVQVTVAAETHHYGGPEVQAAGKAVEAVVASLVSKPFPASSPPEWLDGERAREWWLGNNQDLATRQRKREEEERAVYYQQQQAYAPYMALLQQMTGQAQASPPAVLDPQLQSILAVINQPAPQAQGISGYLPGDGKVADGIKDGRGKKKSSLPAHKPTNKALIGTKMCTFWQQGKCARGDKCTFKHK
ncbi:hypothetical protein XA68_10927 [Ophiocordyceps unilateralis]|uniref:C3H1-type domain-containing protein n=1 Tax=Ophiocordyceps unilateralis TaxID=268505 RepID=A0A2A9PHQ8_OPHUN|nr:hypothetical protein XA68_10927 [Ophiocordyceps unilateralis]